MHEWHEMKWNVFLFAVGSACTLSSLTFAERENAENVFKKGTNVQIFESISVYISFKILFDFLVCVEMNSMPCLCSAFALPVCVLASLELNWTEMWVCTWICSVNDMNIICVMNIKEGMNFANKNSLRDFFSYKIFLLCHSNNFYFLLFSCYNFTVHDKFTNSSFSSSLFYPIYMQIIAFYSFL
jgi:hypothetical protein